MTKEELKHEMFEVAAKKQKMRFKDASASILSMKQFLGDAEQGKLYPVPDGYEIKFKCIDPSSVKAELYAILVPKQEPNGIKMNYAVVDEITKQELCNCEFPKYNGSTCSKCDLPYAKQEPVKIPTQKEFEDACLDKSPIPKQEPETCPKCRTADFAVCHSMHCPMRKEEPVKQPTSIEGISDEQVRQEAELSGIKIPISIEEAAENHISGKLYKSVRKESFIAGAKSDAAKEYWFEIFKQEKK